MTTSKEQIIQALNESLDDSRPSNVTPDIIAIDGMSGAKYKRFINRLLAKPFVNNYLEIGVWKGSTAISALHGNHAKLNYHLIDNWSEFGGPRTDFINNWRRFIGGEPRLIDQDCFSFDPIQHGIGKIDVYFYDGLHDELSQYLALRHYYHAMNGCFVFIVDDWDWPAVKSGTNRAIADLKLKIAHQQEFRGEYRGGPFDADNWWNGCGIFVLEK